MTRKNENMSLGCYALEDWKKHIKYNSENTTTYFTSMHVVLPHNTKKCDELKTEGKNGLGGLGGSIKRIVNLINNQESITLSKKNGQN